MINPAIFNLWGWNPTGDFGPLTIYTAKNKKPVFFLKAPPTKPATARQRFVRDRFGYHAAWWSQQTKTVKDLWERAAKKAHLRMTGYNLWQWWHWHRDRAVLDTIQRQANVDLNL